MDILQAAVVSNRTISCSDNWQLERMTAFRDLWTAGQKMTSCGNVWQLAEWQLSEKSKRLDRKLSGVGISNIWIVWQPLKKCYSWTEYDKLWDYLAFGQNKNFHWFVKCCRENDKLWGLPVKRRSDNLWRFVNDWRDSDQPGNIKQSDRMTTFGEFLTAGYKQAREIANNWTKWQPSVICKQLDRTWQPMRISFI